MFTNNCRDEVTLIFLKHLYSNDLHTAIRKTFEEVRTKNAGKIQPGSYEAIAEVCADFEQSIAAEPAQVG